MLLVIKYPTGDTLSRLELPLGTPMTWNRSELLVWVENYYPDPDELAHARSAGVEIDVHLDAVKPRWAGG